MKNVLLKSLIPAILDIIINGIPYLILKNKYENMEIIFIISVLICLIIVFLYYHLDNKLKCYTHAQNIQTFTQLSIIQDIFQTHPEIADEYMRNIEGMKNLNPIPEKTLDDLFIFDKESNYKELIKQLEKKINESNPTT